MFKVTFDTDTATCRIAGEGLDFTVLTTNFPASERRGQIRKIFKEYRLANNYPILNPTNNGIEFIVGK